MTEILVVTCPSGKQSSHLLPLLYNKGRFKLRLAAHSESSAAKLKSTYPDAEVVPADLANLDDCRKLLRGAHAINAVLPSLHSREKEMGFNLIDAAVEESRREGNVFAHFVQSSVMCTQHRNLVQHNLKSYVEEALFLSPLDCWTVIKPTNFLDAYPVARLSKEEQPLLVNRWNASLRNSVIALVDLAEATAKVLNEREVHFLAEYPLCSTLPVSDAEIVRAIENRIGKAIEIRTPTLEEATDRLNQALFGGQSSGGDPRPDIVRDTAARLILFYNHRGLKGSPNTLRWLLGREPTTIDQWVASQLIS